MWFILQQNFNRAGYGLKLVLICDLSVSVQMEILLQKRQREEEETVTSFTDHLFNAMAEAPNPPGGGLF